MISCIPVSTFICNKGYDCGPRHSYEQQQQQQQQKYTRATRSDTEMSVCPSSNQRFKDQKHGNIR